MTQPESRTVEERLAAVLAETEPLSVVLDATDGLTLAERAWSRAQKVLAAAKEHGLVIGEGERLSVDALREALYTVSVRHNWEQMTDTVDRTEEIAAEYGRLRR